MKKSKKQMASFNKKETGRFSKNQEAGFTKKRQIKKEEPPLLPLLFNTCQVKIRNITLVRRPTLLHKAVETKLKEPV